MASDRDQIRARGLAAQFSDSGGPVEQAILRECRLSESGQGTPFTDEVLGYCFDSDDD